MFYKYRLLFLSLLLIAGCFLLLPRKDWKRYYAARLYMPPAQVVEKAFKEIPQAGKAIDLGCGAGNDTAFLLSKGWKVWAIDSEPAAIQIVLHRNDLVNKEDLIPMVAKFEELDWEALPHVSFIAAVNALPFCNAQNFHPVWKNIVHKISSQGFFAGHFFGTRYKGFTDEEAKNMTFLTKEAVLDLFQEFEILFFEEKEESIVNSTGRATHPHIFEVVARKLN